LLENPGHSRGNFVVFVPWLKGKKMAFNRKGRGRFYCGVLRASAPPVSHGQ
jgi:hypothetical protein